MFAKNLFKNEDGTLKAFNITVFVCLIVGLIMAFFLRNTNVFKPAINTVTTTNPISTTTIALCDNCSFKFTKDSIDVEAGTEVPLEDIIDYENVTLTNISFKSDDTSVAKVVSHSGKLYIKTEDVVGTAKITAEYDKINENMTINVIATTIRDAHLKDQIYFAYLNKKNKIDIDTTPKGASYKLLKLSTENPEIAEFNDNGELVGKAIGETKIYLETKRELTEEEKKEQTASTESAPIDLSIREEKLCYVISNMITIKIKEGSSYRELSEYKYRGTYSGEITVALSIEDNNKENLTGKDITWEIIPMGSMNGTISYEGKAANNVDYLYKVSVSFNQEEAMDENKITVYFSLPDGSKNRLTIVKE